MFTDKVILVTGGTGSMGKVLVRRLLAAEHGTPKKIIILSRDEAKQHDMRLSYLHKTVTTDEVIYSNFMRTLEFRIGDVRNYKDVLAAMQGVDIVINAAALKQVPICEYFPYQALMTNCEGPMNIVRAITEHKLPVETVVGISTDKACKPVNVMGMTKSIHERILIAGNIQAQATRFICVRYGNVMASRGSVIPMFKNQITNGGPVTITLPEMTRFLLTIDQAVDTVFAAIKNAAPGETFVPNAPAANILNIAKALIGNRNIPIKTNGIRPGEKIHEIMVSDEECHFTERRGNYLAITSMLPELQSPNSQMTKPLTKAFSSGDKVLDLNGTIALLKKHNLLHDLTAAPHQELLV